MLQQHARKKLEGLRHEAGKLGNHMRSGMRQVQRPPRIVKLARLVHGVAVRTLWRRPTGEISAYVGAALPDLGPTYIKIGQFVSSRKDIFGKDVAAGLCSLQDAVPPMSQGELRGILDRHADLLDRLDTFYEEPLASASIAQVHRARLRDGSEVILKIKRPGLQAMIRRDLSLFLLAMRLMGMAGVPEAAYSQRLLDDFQAMLISETDYERETRNNEAFAAMYARRSDVIVPRVLRDLSTEEVLVMEYVPSRRVNDYGGNRPALAYRLMAMFLGQVLYEGHIIHGDPQPGNLGITDDDKIVLYDFGNALSIDNEYRTRLKVALYHIVTNEPREALRTMRMLGVRVLDESLAARYVDLYARYVRTIDYSIFDIGERAMPFELTDDLMRLCKVFGTLEGVCKNLDDEFDYASMTPVVWDAFLLDPGFVVAKAALDLEAFLGQRSEPDSA